MSVTIARLGDGIGTATLPARILDAGERRPALVVGAIVAVSAIVRAGVAQWFDIPWVGPDEMIYGLVGESLWETGRLSMRGIEISFYSLLTPALVGLPLAVAKNVNVGLAVAQGLQALAMSLVAVPVYLWGKHLVGTRWALVAATLVVLPPALWYGGLLMTEALFYPLVTVALLALARMLDEPTTARQGVALLAITAAAAVRLQALVLLPVLIVAVGLHALFGRTTATARRLIPVLGLIGVATVGVLALHVFGRGNLLGAYGDVTENAPSSAGALTQLAWYGGAMVAMTLVLPVLATATLAVLAGVRGEPDPAVRSFLAVTTAYVTLLVVQVTTFAISYLDHISERYLVTAVPVLLLGLCVWLGRGRERPLRVGVPVAAAAIALLASIPASRLGAAPTVANSFTFLPLDGLVDRGRWEVRGALAGLSVATACAFLFLPRRLLPLGALGVAAGFVALSVTTAIEIDRYSGRAHRLDLGRGDTEWVDRAGVSPVLLVYTGESAWTAPSRLMLRNRSIRQIARLEGAEAGGVPDTPFTIRRDGALVREDGSEITYPYVVLPATAAADGERLASGPPTAIAHGSALWRVDEPLRLASRSEGFTPFGDFHLASILVYRCEPGALRLTLVGRRRSSLVLVRVNGRPWKVVPLRKGRRWSGSVRPTNIDRDLPCVFELGANRTTRATRVEWVPDRRL